MRHKDDPRPALPAAALCEELERLGLARADAGPLADELLGLARAMPEREFQALLEGIVLAQRAGQRPAPRTPELHRILEDFASELKKLDEGLRLLTAYLSRLRDQTAAPASRTLH